MFLSSRSIRPLGMVLALVVMVMVLALVARMAMGLLPPREESASVAQRDVGPMLPREASAL